GFWILFTSDVGGNDRRDLYRVPAKGGRVEKLTDTKVSETEPRFSPDGKQIAYTADPDQEFVFQLHVMDLETRKVRELTHEQVKLQSLAWSPEGKTIAINRSGDDQKGDLLLIDVATAGKIVVPPLVKDGNIVPEQFSPDGTKLLLTAQNEAGFYQMCVLALTPGEPGKPPTPAKRPTFFGPEKWDVSSARWHRTGIYFVRNEVGAFGLYFAAEPAAKIQTILPAKGMISQVHLDRSGDNMVLLFEDTSRPADVWLVRGRDHLDTGTGIKPQPVALKQL